jgi:hypothetical protein
MGDFDIVLAFIFIFVGITSHIIIAGGDKDRKKQYYPEMACSI